MTLLNKSIVIDNTRKFTKDIHVSAYRLIILIHEIGHMFVRINCTSAQATIEYESRESSYASSPTNNQSAKKKPPESGFQLEESVFGKRVKELNTLAAEFIMNPENWSMEDFQNQFNTLNNAKFDSDGKKVKSIRMRCNIDEDVYFRRDWCGTSHYRGNPNS